MTYTPNTGFKGIDTFTYTVSDGTDTAVATVSVDVADAGPIAVDDLIATLPATAVTISVLANDSDPNGDPLTITAVTQPAGGAGTGVSVDNGDGTVTFTPNAAFRGTATFTYTITDGTDTATAMVSVTVPDAAPVAIDDYATTASNTSVIVPVLANDLDDNGDPLTITAVTQPAGGAATGVSVDNGDGTVTFTPNSAFRGTATFTYTITDGTDTATATVRVTVDNAPPTALPDSATTPVGTPVVIDALANDSDANGDALVIIDASIPANGSVTLGAGSAVTYTPNPTFEGADTFSYTVSDGTASAVAVVTIIVGNAAPVAVTPTLLNSPPVATPDSATTRRDTAVTIAVLGNDRDPDLDALALVGVARPANGTATINADGTATYVPDSGFVGTDVFTYTMTDGTDTAVGTVTVTVVEPALAASQPQQAPRGQLAFTGAPVTSFFVAGSVLLLVGFAFVAGSRRRRSA